jgi:hypothetical protein
VVGTKRSGIRLIGAGSRTRIPGRSCRVGRLVQAGTQVTLSSRGIQRANPIVFRVIGPRSDLSVGT